MPQSELTYKQTFYATVTVDASTAEEAVDEVEKNPWSIYWDWTPGEDTELIEIDGEVVNGR